MFIAIGALVVVLYTSVSNLESVHMITGRSEDRLASINNPLEDASLLMRIELGYYAIQRFMQNPLIGMGFGDMISYQLFGDQEVFYLDNSYVYFLWKGGIVAFVLYFWIYYRLFKQCIRIMTATKEPFIRSIIIGIVAGFCGILFFGLFAANLFKYNKTNLFYALVFAYVEYLAYRINAVQIDSVSIRAEIIKA